jgi:hypothetical protein
LGPRALQDLPLAGTRLPLLLTAPWAAPHALHQRFVTGVFGSEVGSP